MVHWAIGIVRRQFVFITSIALLIASLGAVYALLAPPTYTAEATILIDPRRVQLFQGATFAEGQMDAPALESQIELVKSEPVALAVIKQLRLEDDAEFLSSDPGLAGVLRSALHFFVPNEPSKASVRIRGYQERTRGACEKPQGQSCGLFLQSSDKISSVESGPSRADR